MENMSLKAAMLQSNSSVRKYCAKPETKPLGEAMLLNSKLYHPLHGKALMKDVNKVSVTPHFNIIEMLDGTRKVYTANWHLLVRRVGSYVTMKGFLITSGTDVEREPEYNIIKGDALKVFDKNGNLIHDGVRAFMPINKTYHLVRYADGSWMYCMNDGGAMRSQPLCKTNLSVGRKALMFDERGKLRLGMRDAYYNDRLDFE